MTWFLLNGTCRTKVTSAQQYDRSVHHFQALHICITLEYKDLFAIFSMRYTSLQ